ncbi:hypothetical protein E4U35_006110 [Claviceps purpurea]|nr:hypothetical protein E4U35_006110 [Claviceps purpurea]
MSRLQIQDGTVFNRSQISSCHPQFIQHWTDFFEILEDLCRSKKDWEKVNPDLPDLASDILEKPATLTPDQKMIQSSSRGGLKCCNFQNTRNRTLEPH